MSTIGQRRLNERERELIAGVIVVNNIANYPGSHIPDWKKLKAVVEALGGKWKSRVGFTFDDDVDAAERIRLAQTSGEIQDPRSADFFATPPELVELMLERSQPTKKHVALEPSAGTGNIALPLKPLVQSVVCVEAFDANFEKLKALGFDTTKADFLTLKHNFGSFDRVLMNPPFSKRQDVHHITHAFNFLAKGGVLVAIAAAGVRYRDDSIGKKFRAFVKSNDGEIWDNPDGAFKKFGTMVRTVMIRIRKAR